MLKIIKRLHLFVFWKAIVLFGINHIFVGPIPRYAGIKRTLFRCLGYKVGEGTTIVGPVRVHGSIEIGAHCWINSGFTVEGNGGVFIGNNCDIAPHVTFLTGGHKIGDADRRAGAGENYSIKVSDGCWLGAHSTILGSRVIGESSVVAACACVTSDVPANTLVAGVPAVVKRILD